MTAALLAGAGGSALFGVPGLGLMGSLGVAGTLASAASGIQSGKAQSAAYKAQAKQAESDAKTQTIERKRALIETLANQNVGAAAQGRTISSIANLQQEDVRRAGYDETLIKGGTAAKTSAYKAAGSAAKTSSLLSAASTVGSGAYEYSKLG